MTTKSLLAELESLYKQLNQSDDERRNVELEMRLKQRAKQYAAPQRNEAAYSADEVYHVITFSLGSERYGVDVATIRSVRTADHIARIPAVPKFYRGVINMRGQIVSVLDLRYFFDMPVDERISPREIVVVEAADLTLGLVADHVEDVLTIPRVAVEPVDARYARGVTMGRLVVLDIETLFSDDRLIISGDSRL